MTAHPQEDPGVPAAPSIRPGWYRFSGLCLAIVFAAVGMLFLLLPGTVLAFFNDLSLTFGLGASSVDGLDLYLVLAGSYMYVVTLLAWGIYRAPENPVYPVLLVNAKLASAALSLIFFFTTDRALIYLVNGLVDGSLGAAVLLMFLRWRPRG
jgi:hypothetical protein